MLPIPDPDRLFKWAESAPWDKLQRFIRQRGARGHNPETINHLTRVVEQRRWQEEGRIRYQTASAEGRSVLSQRERIWQASESRLRRRRKLKELQELCPYEFERLIANLFRMQGYLANVVGGTSDDGVDVEIRQSTGEPWGVAQCKRYADGTRVSAGEVRDFAGAFMLSDAQCGFLFTTGRLSRQARRTARRFDWLSTYTGPQLVKHIAEIEEMYDESRRR